MSHKVAIVTGANKGIGRAITEALALKFPGIVYLTSRDVVRGETALKSMKTANPNAKIHYHQLDITEDESVSKFKAHLIKNDQRIEILVNNAGIYFNSDSKVPFEEQAEKTIGVNYFGTLRVCEFLFPLLGRNAQVVNLSSSAGHLSRIPGENLKGRIKDSIEEAKVDELNDLMKKFIRDVKEGRNEEEGWGNSVYVVAKVGVSALSLIQQKIFDKEGKNVSVNAVHPGYVDTDMTDHKGVMTVEDGARAALFLALESHGLKGKYVWYDCSVVDFFAAAAPKNPK